MSVNITTAFVQQYRDNIHLLVQQKGSRLEHTVMHEPITGEYGYVEQVGPTSTQKRTSRHGDSPMVNTSHSRRRISLDSEEWGDMVDRQDKIRMLIDPTSTYVQNMVHAFNRAKDDHIIDAFFGTAYAGKSGGTSVTFPAAQQVPSGSTGLNVAKLINALELLNEAEVDEDEPKYIVTSQKQISDLLAITEVTSSDYVTVKALVEGKIDTYMGFKFIRSERLPVNGSSERRCPVYTKSGMALGVGKDIASEVGPRADKSYGTYVYGCMDVGATRLEEEKVVEIPCTE